MAKRGDPTSFWGFIDLVAILLYDWFLITMYDS
jgi:hypothetical protein